MNTTTKRAPGWGSDMKSRYFWGMPHGETDAMAFKATMLARAGAVAAGRFDAVAFVEEALERVTRRSTSLLLIDTLLCALVLLMGWGMAGKTGADPAATAAAMPLAYLGRWAFVLALAACVLLMTNLRLVWASNAAHIYGDPDAGYEFTLAIYKGRAWRYSTALVLSFAAFVCTLASIVPPMK